MLRCLFDSYWKIHYSINDWRSMLQIWKHAYYDHFNFIVLYVGILPLFAINLDAVSLLAY